MPPKGTVARDSIQKKEAQAGLTAVIVADNYDNRFEPVLRERSSCFALMPVCNVPAIDYTLEWIIRTEVSRMIILVSADHLELLRNTEQKWKYYFELFTLVGLKNAMSVGDALRDLESRAILTSDFLLLTNPATFTNACLSEQIAKFRQRKKENPDNVMSMIYAYGEHPQKAVTGVKNNTNELALYFHASNPSRLNIDKSLFVNEVNVRRDIFDTGITLCTVKVLLLISTNFDFKQRDDAIREILVNEEILNQKIHIELLSPNECAAQIYDYDSYLYTSLLLMENWLYPLCPENMYKFNEYAFNKEKCNMCFGLDSCEAGCLFSFKGRGTSILGKTTIIGKSCKFSLADKFTNSVIGDGCMFGEESDKLDKGTAVRIENSIVGKNCKFGRCCVVQYSILGDNVTLDDFVSLESGTIVSSNVHVTKEIAEAYITGRALCSFEPGDAFEDGADGNSFKSTKLDDSLYLWRFNNDNSLFSIFDKRRNSTNDGSEEDAMNLDFDSDTEGAAVDPIKIFCEEIYDSMTRILELNFTEQLINNLILEINSSKLANNVTMEDVAKYVFKIFLELPECSTLGDFKKLTTKWRKLFENYYAPPKNKIQLLLAVEEHYESKPEDFSKMLAHVVHHMYDTIEIIDDESIIEWHDGLDQSSPIRTIMAKIIEWLKEDEDDSDDAESD